MSGMHKAPRRRFGGRRAVMVIAAVVLLGITGGPALAAWLTSGLGNTTVGASDLSTPAKPTLSTDGNGRVVVSWQATSLSSGQAATGYVVRRIDTSGTTTVCTVSAPTLTCTDPTPVTTSASYTVAAKFAGWTSAQSTATLYDVAAPTTTLATSSNANSSGWWTTSPVGFTLTATDGGSGVKSITYKVGAGAPVTVNAATATFNVSTQGTTVISYSATDNAGNVESQKSFTLKLDSVAPAAPTGIAVDKDSGSSASDGITNETKPTISGSAEAGATVEIRIDGTLRFTVTAAANGTFSSPTGPGAWGPGTDLTEGSHTLSVRAIDTAGNIGTAATFTMVVDKTNPTVTVTKPTNNQVINNGQWGNGCPQAGFCGTASDSGGIWKVTYQLKRKGAGPAQDACWNGTTFVTGAGACGPAAFITATGTTSWSVALAYASLTAASSYELTVDSYDVAGNSAPNLVVTFSKP
jgi:hypothetical protein